MKACKINIVGALKSPLAKGAFCNYSHFVIILILKYVRVHVVLQGPLALIKLTLIFQCLEAALIQLNKWLARDGPKLMFTKL